MQFGDKLAQHVVAFQKEQNETDANDAYNRFVDGAISQVLYNPEDGGFYGKRGQNALTAYPEASARLNSLQQEIRDGLPNDSARGKFDDMSRRFSVQERQSMARHAGHERRQWVDQTSQSVLANMANEASLRYNDPERVAQTLDMGRLQIAINGQANGMDAETIRAKQLDFAGKVHGQVASTMMLRDPRAAMAYYRANRAQFNPADRLGLEKQIANLEAVQQAREDAAALIQGLMPGTAPGSAPGETTPAQPGSITRSGPFVPDDGLLAAVIKQESGGRQSVVSSKGAIGVMQVMPDSGREAAARLGIPFDLNRLKTDAAYNRQLGTEELRHYMARYQGNQTLALAAYNAGPGRVDEWIKRFGNPNAGEISDAEWAKLIPFSETRNYVASINRMRPPGSGPSQAASAGDPGARLPEIMTMANELAARSANPSYATLLPRLVNQSVRQIQHGQRLQDLGWQNTLFGAASGLDNQPKPATLPELLSKGDPVQLAWANAPVKTQMQVMKLLDQNNRAKEKAEKENAPEDTSGQQEYYRLKGMQIRDPDGFLGEDLGAYIGVMPTALWHELVRDQNSIVNRDSKEQTREEQKEMNLKKTLEDGQIRDALHAAELKDRKGKIKDHHKYDHFVGELQLEMEAYQKEHKRAPDMETKRKMTAELLAKGEKPRWDWLGDWSTKSVKRFEVPRDERGTKFFPTQEANR
ncbi:MAG: transglycosylase SLT domain-containing protein [Magnetococcales bacterium]|nr:transglycosylase SLT domain-containing protein [Magnetococcales bacterium]